MLSKKISHLLDNKIIFVIWIICVISIICYICVMLIKNNVSSFRRCDDYSYFISKTVEDMNLQDNGVVCYVEKTGIKSISVWCNDLVTNYVCRE